MSKNNVESHFVRDRILVFEQGKVVWKRVAYHEDSCSDDAAVLTGVIKKEDASYLILEHLMNDLTFVKLDSTVSSKNYYNNDYNPNADFRL